MNGDITYKKLAYLHSYYVCDFCGAMVHDKDKHSKYHREEISNITNLQRLLDSHPRVRDSLNFSIRELESPVKSSTGDTLNKRG